MCLKDDSLVLTRSTAFDRAFNMNKEVNISSIQEDLESLNFFLEKMLNPKALRLKKVIVIN